MQDLMESIPPIGDSMQFPHIDPVFLKLGPLEFRWYGLMYILGFVASYFVILAEVGRKNIALTKDDVADLVFAVALGIILGGRAGYILFYNLSYYVANPVKLFAVWEGGMSFHGGFAGAILAALYFTRKKKLTFYSLVDIAILAVPIGLGLGRLGNFINGELFGRVTSVPWGVVFPGGGGLPRHPSQLYEAFLEGLLLFLLLRVHSRTNHPQGSVFWAFIGLYGLFRMVVEFFREPDAHIGYLAGGLSMGQMLSLPMFLIGGGMMILGYMQMAKDSNMK
jgi:phosphatidylglycerol:prolipoprotein diacylglycerol transferase